MSKSPNAFLYFRNEKIDLTQERTMVEHSRIAGPKWNELGEKGKRKYYHIAEEAKIRKETETGIQLPVERTFVHGNDYSFVIETPNQKKRARNPGEMIDKRENREKRVKRSKSLPKLQPVIVEDFSEARVIQNDDHQPLKTPLREDPFNEFTIGTDFVPNVAFMTFTSYELSKVSLIDDQKDPFDEYTIGTDYYQIDDDFINKGALPPNPIFIS
ncbi:14569_t:CDS:1 [Funneliformis mosseae]|uniref:14569_t:CDS:1 n=1 Tax=Funneliformis mosseae TaxID=27381 RepID=A0A9N9AVF8_FUNMO|nr:14569_t:CDS:1 [Funneliformis mosseae]